MGSNDNPRSSKARRTAAERLLNESDSGQALDGKSTDVNGGNNYVPGDNAVDAEKLSRGTNRSSDVDENSESSWPNEDTADETGADGASPEPANHSEAENPGPFPIDGSQLSAQDRVSEDMGTIALDSLSGNRRAANEVMPPFAGGIASQLGQMTDAEIMQRAGTGDDACYEFLVAKYRRPIIGFMYRMVHNQAVAEELAQEVFLRVYRARGSYRAEARFTTWLYRIAANMAINHARDTRYERSSSSIYLDQADEDTGARPDVADLRPLAEQDMLRDERMRLIREHVTALPERQRMAVVMHKYQDMDYKQIGAVLKLSESATKSLLFRAYQTLRDRLKEFA
ncbi:MAG: sigma-70 family RNA polymerase sigma factor [Acidobacteriaceae bacterium]